GSPRRATARSSRRPVLDRSPPGRHLRRPDVWAHGRLCRRRVGLRSARGCPMSLVRRLLARAALVLSGWWVAAPVPEVAAQPSTSENADRGLFGDGVAAADTRRPREPSAKTRVRPRVFALVIGSNATLDADLSPLRFADDDAARMTELLREVG